MSRKKKRKASVHLTFLVLDFCKFCDQELEVHKSVAGRGIAICENCESRLRKLRRLEWQLITTVYASNQHSLMET